MGKIVAMSLEERKELVRMYQLGTKEEKDEAVLKMIESLQFFVFDMIRQHFSAYWSIAMDLEQSAKMAIIEHFAEYNPKFKPLTFFYYHIQNAMQDQVNMLNDETHYEAQVKNRVHSIAKAENLDIDNLDFSVIAKKMNASQKRVEQVYTRANKTTVSLDEIQKGENKITPEMQVIKKERTSIIHECVNMLPEMERIIIRMHYGLYDKDWNKDCRSYKIKEIKDIMTNNCFEDFDANYIYRRSKRHLNELILEKDSDFMCS